MLVRASSAASSSCTSHGKTALTGTSTPGSRRRHKQRFASSWPKPAKCLPLCYLQHQCRLHNALPTCYDSPKGAIQATESPKPCMQTSIDHAIQVYSNEVKYVLRAQSAWMEERQHLHAQIMHLTSALAGQPSRGTPSSSLLLTLVTCDEHNDPCYRQMA